MLGGLVDVIGIKTRPEIAAILWGIGVTATALAKAADKSTGYGIIIDIPIIIPIWSSDDWFVRAQ